MPVNQAEEASAFGDTRIREIEKGTRASERFPIVARSEYLRIPKIVPVSDSLQASYKRTHVWNRDCYFEWCYPSQHCFDPANLSEEVQYANSNKITANHGRSFA